MIVCMPIRVNHSNIDFLVNTQKDVAHLDMSDGLGVMPVRTGNVRQYITLLLNSGKSIKFEKDTFIVVH